MYLAGAYESGGSANNLNKSGDTSKFLNEFHA